MLSGRAGEVHRGRARTEDGDVLGPGPQGVQRHRQKRTVRRVPRCQRGLQWLGFHEQSWCYGQGGRAVVQIFAGSKKKRVV